MSYIVFDVETTGLPKNNNISPKQYKKWPYIVQFSWIYVDSKYNKEEKSFIIKPNNYVIPQESINIHRITNKLANSSGIDIKEVIHYFITDCKKTNMLVAHNAQFDVYVILAACYRNNIPTAFIRNKRIICTMKCTTNICKIKGRYGKYKYPRLEELYTFLFGKVPNVKLHNALEDARITQICYEKLTRK